MQKRNGNYRWAPLFLWVAMLGAFGMPGPALAVTLQDCSKEAENVRQAGSKSDDFNPRTFFENFQNHIDEINTITDKDIVLQNMSDILSVEPEDAFEEAIAMLRLCVWKVRLEELGGVDDADGGDAADTDATAEPAESAEAAEEDLASPPTKIDGSVPWFAETDFPASAMRDGRQGIVNYDVTVGADGKVLGCQAKGPPGSADLEAATCDAIFARARFNPATDASGRPTVGEFSGAIRWTIPQ